MFKKLIRRVDTSQTMVIALSNVVNSDIYFSIIEVYKQAGFDLKCIFMDDHGHSLRNRVSSINVTCISYETRTRAKQLKTLARVSFSFFTWKPSIVLCLGQTATVIAFGSALISCDAKRIYLRQHTSSNKQEHKYRGSIYDHFSNLIAHKILTSNQNQASYLSISESVPKEKIAVCEFGFPIHKFREVEIEKIDKIRTKYRINKSYFIVGVVSRLTPIKGYEYTVEAFKRFLKVCPNAVLLFCNAYNSSTDLLNRLSETIPTENLRIVQYEEDMTSVYAVMSVFVHVPISPQIESYGLTYIEAFASGLPTILTRSGIANELAIDQFNCLVVDYCNWRQIYECIFELYSSPSKARFLSQNAITSVNHLTTERMKSQFLEVIKNEFN